MKTNNNLEMIPDFCSTEIGPWPDKAIANNGTCKMIDVDRCMNGCIYEPPFLAKVPSN